MSMSRIESARFRDNRAHGQDTSVVVSINGFLCAVVADGVSTTDFGRVASSFATRTALREFRSHFRTQNNGYCDFNDFVESLWYRLERGLPNRPAGDARTTLTAVVVEPGEAGAGERRWVTAHYVALGDSPIVICRPQWPGTGPSDLAFLCHQIHDRPLVIDDEGRIYSYLDASSGKIRGAPSIGSFRLYEGDICLVMTDGIPAFEHIARDVGAETEFRFLNAVKRNGAKAGVTWMRNLVEQELLADDGSMVIIHFREQGDGMETRELHCRDQLNRLEWNDLQPFMLSSAASDI